MSAPPPQPQECDCCGRVRLLSRCWAPGGVETFACDQCRGIEPDVEPGCICGWSSVNSASIDPPHEVVNKNCPLHGNAAARDPDAVYEAKRDDPPQPWWEEEF